MTPKQRLEIENNLEAAGHPRNNPGLINVMTQILNKPAQPGSEEDLNGRKFAGELRDQVTAWIEQTGVTASRATIDLFTKIDAVVAGEKVSTLSLLGDLRDQVESLTGSPSTN